MKKILNYLKKYRILIIVFILTGSAFYSFFNRTSQPATTPAPTSSKPAVILDTSPLASTIPSPLSTTEPETVTSILSKPIFLADYAQAEQAIYYNDTTTSELKKYDLRTNQETVLSDPLPTIIQGAWSPNHSKIILTTQNIEGNQQINPLFRTDRPIGADVNALYDLSTKAVSPLNDNIVSFSFITNDEIIYQYKDKSANNLSIARPNGQNWRNIDRPRGDTIMLRSGTTVLVQQTGNNIISRYGPGGKKIDRYEIDDAFPLEVSAWANNGLNALYSVDFDGGAEINHIREKKIEQVYVLPEHRTDLTILWDNKSGNIYLAGSDGLERLSVTVKND